MAAPTPEKATDEAPPAEAKTLLRLGVFRGGKLVQTHLVTDDRAVSIGPSPTDTVVLDPGDLRKGYTAFDRDEAGGYRFSFDGSAEGCVLIAGEMCSLADAREVGHGESLGKTLRRLPLEAQARGKVIHGETTIVFQIVEPAPPVDVLLDEVRARFRGHIDWNLLWSFMAMLAVNVGFLLYLHSVDVPRGMAIDAIPDEFAEYLPVIEKERKKIDLKKLAEETGEDKKEKLKKAKVKASAAERQRIKAPVCDAACRAARRARLSRAIAGIGALKILGVKGRGQGVTADLVGAGGAGRRLDQALHGVSGVSATGAGTKFAVRGGGGMAQVAGIGDLSGRVGGPSSVSTGRMLREKVPKYSFKRQSARVEGGAQIDRNKLRRGLRRAARRVKMCYERALRRNPSLGGKVTVRLVISATGRARSVEIDTDTIGAGVAACIRMVMRSQSYPAPVDGTAEVVVPFVFQSSKR